MGYTVTESLPFKVTTHYPYTEVEPWCLENIGLYDQDWYRIPADIAAVALFGDCDETYCFRTKHQAVLFALRWS